VSMCERVHLTLHATKGGTDTETACGGLQAPPDKNSLQLLYTPGVPFSVSMLLQLP